MFVLYSISKDNFRQLKGRGEKTHTYFFVHTFELLLRGFWKLWTWLAFQIPIENGVVLTTFPTKKIQIQVWDSHTLLNLVIILRVLLPISQSKITKPSKKFLIISQDFTFPSNLLCPDIYYWVSFLIAKVRRCNLYNRI